MVKKTCCENPWLLSVDFHQSECVCVAFCKQLSTCEYTFDFCVRSIRNQDSVQERRDKENKNTHSSRQHTYTPTHAGRESSCKRKERVATSTKRVVFLSFFSPHTFLPFSFFLIYLSIYLHLSPLLFHLPFSFLSYSFSSSSFFFKKKGGKKILFQEEKKKKKKKKEKNTYFFRHFFFPFGTCVFISPFSSTNKASL